MGFEVVLVCAFFCMLQFHIGDAESAKLQIRIPADSIDGYSKNPQFNPGVPYPLYRKNFCSRCNSNCGSNSPFRLKCPTNPYVISVPSDKSESGRLTITIDTRKSCNSAKPADNGETSKQTVDVVVKLKPKNLAQDNSDTSTSGKSSATSNKDGDDITANMDGTINIPGSDQALDVIVLVNNDDSGKSPSDQSLDTKIIMDNGKGEVSETDTEADIKKTPEKKSEEANPSDKPANKLSDTPSPDPTPVDSPAPTDGSDSPITGATSDPATPDNTGSDPADTPTPGDSKTPEPMKADPGAPSSTDDDKTSTSSSATSGATADDKKAATDSTSGASADSG